MTSSTQPHLETLEGRDMPSTFGAAWPNARELTISFAADGALVPEYALGTTAHGQTSTLDQEMSVAGPPNTWQREVLRAFQTWAAQSNINFGLRTEGLVNGEPVAFGTPSSAGNPANLGDIRIGSMCVPEGVLAVNQPHSLINPDWSGEVFFNTLYDFSIGQQANRYDLYSVTLNEAGNVLGLADTTDASSALYGSYVGVRNGISTTDVAAVRQLYGGTRQADAFEGTQGNDALTRASRLTPLSLPLGRVAAATGDLTTMTDRDNYVVRTDASTSRLQFRLNTAGISLLTARMTILDSLGNTVGTATSGGSLGNQNLFVDVAVRSGVDYFVRIERATNDVFAIGGYNLQVGYNVDPRTALAGSGTTMGFIADSGTTDNGTITKPTTLTAKAPSGGQFFTHDGKIQSPTDVDWYRVKSPVSRTATTMTVTLNPEVLGSMSPRIAVYNSSGVLVPTQTVFNDRQGRVIVQLANVSSNSDYYFRVDSPTTGNYRFQVDFTQKLVNLSPLTTGTLSGSQTTTFQTLQVAETQMVHFALRASGTGLASNTQVRLTIFNEQGQVVRSLVTTLDKSMTTQALLASGTYFLRFDMVSRESTPPTVNYNLATAVLSDPIDPNAPTDPYTTPPPPPPPTIDPTTNPADYAWLVLLYPWLNPWGP